MHGYRPDECVRCADRAVVAELRAELTAARALLREALAAITDHATQRTFAGGVVLSNTAIKIRAALAAPESSP